MKARSSRLHQEMETGTRSTHRLNGLGALVLVLVSACREPYRVGDLVLVEFDEQDCAGFIVEMKSRSRLRVHFNFEGHTWQEDVAPDRVLGRAGAAPAPCQLPRRVAVALGIDALEKKSVAQRAAYRKGDRVRVRWRESIYTATVIDALEGGRLRVHYDGHEDAWDEEIPVDRIVPGQR